MKKMMLTAVLMTVATSTVAEARTTVITRLTDSNGNLQTIFRNFGNGSSGHAFTTLPSINDNLKLRGPGLGKATSARAFKIVNLPGFATVLATITNGGAGNFSTYAIDTALLQQTRN